MDKDIVAGQVGSVGSYDVEFKGGKLIAKADAAPAAGVHVGAHIELEASAVLDALAKAIPGQIDDAIFGVMKAALLA